MSSAEWTRLADQDLLAIYRYIASQPNRQDVAVNVAHNLRACCDEHAGHHAEGHRLGTDRADLGPGVRTHVYQRWVIVTRPIGNTLQVLRIFDGSRDYDKLFELP